VALEPTERCARRTRSRDPTAGCRASSTCRWAPRETGVTGSTKTVPLNFAASRRPANQYLGQIRLSDVIFAAGEPLLLDVVVVLGAGIGSRRPG